jgi:Domain of unknown function (DUF4349)
MRIIPFPGRDEAGPNDPRHTELEAALDGEGGGLAADSWRELREDVRALAPPMAPGFEHQLRERIAERAVRGRPRKVSPLERAGANTAASSALPAMSTDPAHPGSAPERLRRRLSWLRLPGRLGVAAGIAVIGAVIVALVIAGPKRAGGGPLEALPPQRAASSNSGAGTSASAIPAAKVATAGSAGSIEPVPGGAGSPPGRIQQLAASLSLTATPSDVQAIADRVARLVVNYGGFVQSSQVQVQQAGTSEASLMLRLPSAKLSGALASLGGLAPVRAESQSLQDITDEYDGARQRVTDATAERQALLRALARATTQEQIENLHERLAQTSRAIAQARSAFQTISRHASTAEVEVTVVGDTRPGSEGLTLHRGLRDAGRVLVVTLVVLMVAVATVLPLALLFTALFAARRTWRRYQRERVLDTP